MTDRILWLLFDFSIKAVLLAVLAELLLRALRIKTAAPRHSVWTAVLYSLLALVPLGPMPLGFSIPLLPAWTAQPASAPPVSSIPAPALPEAHDLGNREPMAAAVEESALLPAPAAAEPAAWSWQKWLALTYVLGVCFMGARLAVGLGLSRRLVRRGREVTAPEVQDICRRLCSVAGLAKLPLIVESSAARVPLTLGCWRPCIVLPESWRSWTAAKLESVLAHELAHHHRGDNWTHLVISVLRSIYWFHPAAWLISSRISMLAEEACDDLATRWTGSRIVYARHLLEVASALQGTPARIALAALPMARKSQIGQRIEALLREPSEPSRTFAKGPVIATLVTCALLTAVFHLEPKAVASATAPAAGKTTAQIQALSSPDPQARADAAVELRLAGAVDPEAIPALVRLLGDRASVRAILDDNEEPVGPLSLARTTPGEEASKTLGYYGNVAVEPLLQTLGSSRAETRVDAVTALGRTRSRRAVQPLNTALEDPSAAVRKMAAWALGTIADATALEAVTRATKDEDAEVRNMASWARTKLELSRARSGSPEKSPDKKATFEILRADLENKDYRLRLKAAHALSSSSDPRALDALLEALQDSYYGVRLKAATGLSRSEDPRAREALRAALKDADYRVRLQAVEALGRQRDGANVAALREALKDPDYRVRLHAASRLARWGEGEGLSMLRQGLRHEHQQVRMLSAAGLGQTGSPNALDPLSGALQDKDHRVRRIAAEALGELGNRDAIAPLTRALEDKNTEVREAAQKALERLNNATQGNPAA